MKDNIHPEMFELEVTDSKGRVFKVLSARKNPLVLNNCREMHPAWTKNTSISKNDSKYKKLEKFFE